jgi:hypothetical protein
LSAAIATRLALDGGGVKSSVAGVSDDLWPTPPGGDGGAPSNRNSSDAFCDVD